MTTFKIDNLSLSLKDREKVEKFSLKNLSLEIPSGHILGLLGGNGMGKTTLIRCIFDHYREYTGTISFNGESNYKHTLATISDSFPLNDSNSIQHISSLMKRVFTKWDENIFQSYINRYGLSMKETPKTLSLGMKQRLMVAISLSHHAKLLVFDEPTDGIDPFDREMILDDIKDYQYREEATVIISSHNTTMLDSFVDYLAYIEDGKLIYFSDIETLYDSGHSFLEQNNVHPYNLQEFSEDPGIMTFVTALQVRYMGDIK